MRYAILTVTGTPRQLFATHATIQDSKFLNEILSIIDPGEEYAVKFTNKKPRASKGQSLQFLSRS